MAIDALDAQVGQRPGLLKVGLVHVQSARVEPMMTVPALSQVFTGFADMPPVFATAFMIGFIEWTCVQALRPYLSEGQQTVGTHVDVSHVAATRVGMTVTAESELIAVEGRKLRFRVACRDDIGLVGEGLHERAIVERERFLARANARRRESGDV